MTAIAELKELERRLSALPLPLSKWDRATAHAGAMHMEMLVWVELAKLAAAMNEAPLDLEQIQRAVSAAAKKAELLLKD